jgi:hypothetical protein
MSVVDQERSEKRSEKEDNLLPTGSAEVPPGNQFEVAESVTEEGCPWGAAQARDGRLQLRHVALGLGADVEKVAETASSRRVIICTAGERRPEPGQTAHLSVGRAASQDRDIRATSAEGIGQRRGESEVVSMAILRSRYP